MAQFIYEIEQEKADEILALFQKELPDATWEDVNDFVFDSGLPILRDKIEQLRSYNEFKAFKEKRKTEKDKDKIIPYQEKYKEKLRQAKKEEPLV